MSLQMGGWGGGFKGHVRQIRELAGERTRQTQQERERDMLTHKQQRGYCMSVTEVACRTTESKGGEGDMEEGGGCGLVSDVIVQPNV